MEESTDGALEEALAHALDSTAQKVIATLEKDATRALKDNRRVRKGFERRLYRRWAEAIDLIELVLIIAREAGEKFNNDHRPNTGDVKLDVLTRLHARACLVASEIIALLRGGFASGAQARWRALHETSVVSFFIAQQESETAERYMHHEIVQSNWAAREYEKYREQLGEEALDSEFLREVEDECERLGQKYGKAYFSDYGWAAEAVCKANPSAKGKIGLRHLEEIVGLDHLRPYYRLAGHGIHANPKSVRYNLGLLNQNEVLLAGPSNSGLSEPGMCTCISLHQVTVALLNHDPSLETVISLKALEAFSQKAKEAFARIQRELEDEERQQQQSNTNDEA